MRPDNGLTSFLRLRDVTDELLRFSLADGALIDTTQLRRLKHRQQRVGPPPHCDRRLFDVTALGEGLSHVHWCTPGHP